MKFLQSNPVQILLCFLVLLDGGIVIAQILLDLHSVRGKQSKQFIHITNNSDFLNKFRTKSCY